MSIQISRTAHYSVIVQDVAEAIGVFNPFLFGDVYLMVFSQTTWAV